MFSLDASFNDLCDLQVTVSWLSQLSSLKMLALEGNPLILASNYHNILLEHLPTLKVLDSNPILRDQSADPNATSQ